MAIAQQLKVWASVLNVDGVTNVPQRRELFDEEFIDGYLLNTSVSDQTVNQMFHLLSLYANPFSNAPSLYPTSLTVPTEALELDGSAILEVDVPNAFAIYGATLPDLTGDAPTGFTYIIRKS